MGKFIILFLFLTVSIHLYPQKMVGDFTLTNVGDDSPISLYGCEDCKAVAIIFAGTTCPYDQYYTGRIKELITSYQDRIRFLLINSYSEPEESVESMKAYQSRLGYSVPYLSDKDQIAMNILGARRSPEVFLLKKVNDKYAIVYSGALDDNPQLPGAVHKRFLKDAIDKLLVGQEVEVSATRSVGCSIRKK